LADYNAERSLRTEYLTAVGQFISQAGQIMAEMPAAAPYLLKMIAWVTSAFRGASDIETVLDEAIQQVSKPKPPNPGEDPMAEGKNAQMSEQARAQADVQSTQAKSAATARDAQVKVQSAAAINQSKTQSAAQQALIKVAAEHMMPKDQPKGEA
jgi:hypothetical protein